MDSYKSKIFPNLAEKEISGLYYDITKTLRKLLGFNFENTESLHKNVVGHQLLHALKLNEENTFKAKTGRDLILCRLQFLISHLINIKNYDLSLFKLFKKKITKIRILDDFIGIRLEINIASSLIRKYPNFIKRESPDFDITFNNGICSIECTSAHQSEQSPKDNFYKIQSCINNKDKMDYCNEKTALFVDATNIIFNNNEKLWSKMDIKKKILGLFETANFGSIFLFTYMFDGQRCQFMSNYMRYDNPNIDQILFEFLNETFPFGDLVLNDAYRLIMG